MSRGNPFRTKVHIGVPHTTEVACGASSHQANGMYREHITCKQCKQTDLYKRLPNLPARFRKTKREAGK